LYFYYVYTCILKSRNIVVYLDVKETNQLGKSM